MDLRGRTAMITGASRGLGEALAHELARRGARVALVARDAEALARVAAAVCEAGGEAHALPADVADKNAVYALAGAAAAVAGPVDVLVHNAGTLGPEPLQLLLDTDCEDLERALAVNVLGPFRLTKALAGSMALRGGGVVVHVGTDAAVNAYPRWGAYGVSKAALEHLARCFHAELAEAGLRFLTVDPGDMDTRMHAAAVPDADPSTLARPADVARRVADMIERAESLAGARLEAQSWNGAGAP